MNNTPKCPGCGREMVPREDFHKFFFVCLNCGWKSPYGQNEKEGLDLALKRTEPKNRVLTLEELKNHAGFLWNENRYSYEGEPAFVEEGYRDWETDRKSTRLNSSHSAKSRMPSSA